MKDRASHREEFKDKASPKVESKDRALPKVEFKDRVSLKMEVLPGKDFLNHQVKFKLSLKVVSKDKDSRKVAKGVSRGLASSVVVKDK